MKCIIFYSQVGDGEKTIYTEVMDIMITSLATFFRGTNGHPDYAFPADPQLKLRWVSRPPLTTEQQVEGKAEEMPDWPKEIEG